MKFLLPKISLVVSIFLLSACGGGGGGGTTPPPPVVGAPTANAGSDQTVNEQTAVALSGSGTDSNGTISTYGWTQTGGAAQTLTGADTATPSFDTPVTTVQLLLTFRLTVTDNSGATGSDTVDITVEPVNALPIANAGADQNIPEGSYVSLFGIASDTDGNIASGAWSQNSGTAVSFTDGDQLNASVSIPSGTMGETLVFSLEVTDNEGGTASDEVSFVVGAALLMKEYTGDEDPDPLDNVTIDIAEVGTSSLVPATMGTHGYETIVVNPTDTYNFTIAPDSLTLTGTGAPMIAVNDVIVGVTADETAGYARAVTAINGSVFTTIAAPLNQVFPDAEVNLDINIFNDTIAANSSVKGSDGRLQAVSSAVNILKFNRTLQHEIRPGVTTRADLAMNSGFNVKAGFDISEGTITKLSSIASVNYSTAAYFDVNLTGKFSDSINKPFKPIFDKTRVIYVPTPSGIPIPVFVNVKAVPAMGAGIGMSAAGKFRYGFKVGGAARAGFEYANNSITNIAEFKPSMNRIGPTYTLKGGLKMNAQASIGVIVTLYDIKVDVPTVGRFEFSGPGLGVDFGPYAKFNVEAKYDSQATPPLSCALDLSVGINSDLSIDYGTLGSQLGISNPRNINLYKSNKSLWKKGPECPFGLAVGNLTGTVIDSRHFAIGEVSVQVKNDAEEVVAETTSASNGQYQIDEIVIGSYTAFYSKPGYTEAMANLVITEDVTEDLPVTLVQEGEGELFVAVEFSDSTNGFIPDASIVIREGLNNPTGDFVASLKSAIGYVGIILDAGYYTLQATQKDYGSGTASVSVKNSSINPTTKTVVIERPPTIFRSYTVCFVGGTRTCHGLDIIEDTIGDGIAIVVYALHAAFQFEPFSIGDYDTSISLDNSQLFNQRGPCLDGSHRDYDYVINSNLSLDFIAGTGSQSQYVTYPDGCQNETTPIPVAVSVQ